jgi:hypothetical protein
MFFTQFQKNRQSQIYILLYSKTSIRNADGTKIKCSLFGGVPSSEVHAIWLPTYRHQHEQNVSVIRNFYPNHMCVQEENNK